MSRNDFRIESVETTRNRLLNTVLTVSERNKVNTRIEDWRNDWSEGDGEWIPEEECWSVIDAPKHTKKRRISYIPPVKGPEGEPSVFELPVVETEREVDEDFNKKIFLTCESITKVKCEAIVNAADENCLGGGGVDGAIHRAAGELLPIECASLYGLIVGKEAKITKGYNLPARYVIHVAGPRADHIEERKLELLKGCYQKVLECCLKYKIESVLFCKISTGHFGIMHDVGAKIAISTTREFLEKNEEARKIFKQIAFSCWSKYEDSKNASLEAYKHFLHVYFPKKG